MSLKHDKWRDLDVLLAEIILKINETELMVQSFLPNTIMHLKYSMSSIRERHQKT